MPTFFFGTPVDDGKTAGVTATQKRINMAVQSENERNKAVVDEYVAAWGGGYPIKVNGEVVRVIVSAAHPRCRMTLIARKRPSRSYRMGFQKNNKGASIMMHSHQTAPTQFVEANSIRFAYRRFGKTEGVPLVLSQHYIGTMDYWDPTVTDGLARDREVILFNNAGVSSSSGEVPTTFKQMAADAIAFIKALGLKQVDLFARSAAWSCRKSLAGADLVRRLIVDGAGPRGGQGMELIAQATGRLFGATYDPPENAGSRSISVRPQQARPRDGKS